MTQAESQKLMMGDRIFVVRSCKDGKVLIERKNVSDYQCGGIPQVETVHRTRREAVAYAVTVLQARINMIQGQLSAFVDEASKPTAP